MDAEAFAAAQRETLPAFVEGWSTAAGTNKKQTQRRSGQFGKGN